MMAEIYQVFIHLFVYLINLIIYLVIYLSNSHNSPQS